MEINKIKFETCIEGFHPTLLQTDQKLFEPRAQTIDSAGLDIRTVDDLFIRGKEIVSFRTGVKMTECPKNVFLMMELRSSLRFKMSLTQLGVGIIDSDYRGEIRGLLLNLSSTTVRIDSGERVAQLIPLYSAMKHVSQEFISNKERSGGFGSTGRL